MSETGFGTATDTETWNFSGCPAFVAGQMLVIFIDVCVPDDLDSNGNPQCNNDGSDPLTPMIQRPIDVAVNVYRPKTAPAQDFNGDFMSDVLWRNKATGDVDMWLMNGSTIADPQFVYNVSDLNWQIIGKGDFDGDGKADILWRDQSTGSIVVWLMNGASLAGSGFVYSVPDPNWQVAGIADFDGDGKADILWRNKSTGAVVLWLMNGTAISSSHAVYS
ncbi:MAG TPA: VCBS repeat-containing protein, partial [Candidatus Angelobacter sp.]|nr:VCBS repeat-containing protein [Candidatus Angelobacter sp.]